MSEQADEKGLLPIILRNYEIRYPLLLRMLRPSVDSVREALRRIQLERIEADAEGKVLSREKIIQYILQHLRFIPRDEQQAHNFRSFLCVVFHKDNYHRQEKIFDSILMDDPFRFARFYMNNRLPQNDVGRFIDQGCSRFVDTLIREGIKIEEFQELNDMLVQYTREQDSDASRTAESDRNFTRYGEGASRGRGVNPGGDRRPPRGDPDEDRIEQERVRRDRVEQFIAERLADARRRADELINRIQANMYQLALAAHRYQYDDDSILNTFLRGGHVAQDRERPLWLDDLEPPPEFMNYIVDGREFVSTLPFVNGVAVAQLILDYLPELTEVANISDQDMADIILHFHRENFPFVQDIFQPNADLYARIIALENAAAREYELPEGRDPNNIMDNEIAAMRERLLEEGIELDVEIDPQGNRHVQQRGRGLLSKYLTKKSSSPLDDEKGWELTDEGANKLFNAFYNSAIYHFNLHIVPNADGYVPRSSFEAYISRLLRLPNGQPIPAALESELQAQLNAMTFVRNNKYYIQSDYLPQAETLLEHYSVVPRRGGGRILDKYLRQSSSPLDDEKGFELTSEGALKVIGAFSNRIFQIFNLRSSIAGVGPMIAFIRGKVVHHDGTPLSNEEAENIKQALQILTFKRNGKLYVHSDKQREVENLLEHFLPEDMRGEGTMVPSPIVAPTAKRRRPETGGICRGPIGLGFSEKAVIAAARQLAAEHGIKGRGLFSSIKEKAKNIYKGFKEKILPTIKNVGLVGFQELSNLQRADARKRGIPSRNLAKGELHYPLKNWEGPGTIVTGNENVPPIDAVDAVAKKHDLAYYAASKISDPAKRAEAVHKADEEAIQGFSKHLNVPGGREGLLMIAGKWTLEQALSALKGVATTVYS